MKKCSLLKRTRSTFSHLSQFRRSACAYTPCVLGLARSVTRRLWLSPAPDPACLLPRKPLHGAQAVRAELAEGGALAPFRIVRPSLLPRLHTLAPKPLIP